MPYFLFEYILSRNLKGLRKATENEHKIRHQKCPNLKLSKYFPNRPLSVLQCQNVKLDKSLKKIMFTAWKKNYNWNASEL